MDWSDSIDRIFPDVVFRPPEKYVLSTAELQFIKDTSRGTHQEGITHNKTGVHASDNYYILNEEILSELKSHCENWLSIYSHEVLKVDINTEFYITQSWANYMPTNGYHHIHTHPNSVISGTFYVQTDGTPVQFHDSVITGGWKKYLLDLNFEEVNDYNASVFWFNSVENEMIFFPSSLPHSVKENEFMRDRISISFNTFARGVIGVNEGATELML